MKKTARCTVCGNSFDYGQMYEYRGFISCDACFDELQDQVNFKRQEVIEEQEHKTDRFKGLDMSDSPIGKANRDIMKNDIEIAKKQSKRITDYESGKL